MKKNKKHAPSVNFKSLGKTIKLMYQGNEVTSILVIVFSLLSALLSAIAMSFTKELYDTVIADAINNGFSGNLVIRNFFIKWGIFLGLSVIFQTILGFLTVTVSQGTLRYVRNKMFSNMQYLPVSFFDKNKYGDIMSRYTNDVDTLDTFINQTLPNLVNVLTSVITYLIMMIINNIILTICVVVILTLIMTLSGTLLKKSTKHFYKRQQIIGRMNGYIEEMMGGTRVVQVFNHQEESIKDFDKIKEEYRQEEMKGNMIGNIVGPLNGNLVRIEYILIALIGAFIVIKSASNVNPYTIGMLAAFLIYTNSFSNPVARFAQELTSVALASAGSERIIELMNMEHEEDNGYVTLVNVNVSEDGTITETDKVTHKWAWKHPHQDGSLTYTMLEGNIVLDKVDFSYRPEHQILYDIDIYANPGERIALVGETGAGKTTITNLINRFYDIEDGKIRYDGININKIKKSDLRRSLGLVLQDTNLFTGTIKDNIRVGKKDATDEEIIEAAKIANADGFIRMMPNGYDTVLTRAGEKLSQGQRQLIAIARAAIADCPVLILDEATSSIDTRTESIIQKGMDKLMENRTVFVIAHRLSTIQNSDAIMVMEHGRIIERGTHESLLNKHGRYYELYTGKFELE